MFVVPRNICVTSWTYITFWLLEMVINFMTIDGILLIFVGKECVEYYTDFFRNIEGQLSQWTGNYCSMNWKRECLRSYLEIVLLFKDFDEFFYVICKMIKIIEQ